MSKTSKAIQNEVLRLLQEELGPLGFSLNTRKRRLERDHDGCKHFIAVSAIPGRSGQDHTLKVHLHVRFGDVEALISRCEPDNRLGTKESAVSALLENITRRRRVVRDETSIPGAWDRIRQDVLEHGLPFLEHYSSLETLSRELSERGCPVNDILYLPLVVNAMIRNVEGVRSGLTKMKGQFAHDFATNLLRLHPELGLSEDDIPQ